MKIRLSHTKDLKENGIIIFLNVSTEDNGYYFEKLFGLKENGRYLVIQAFKETSAFEPEEDYEYPYSADIEGIIYDNNGEVIRVPENFFSENISDEIEKWIDENEEKWHPVIDK